jgi:hypothetical protein
MIRFKRLVEARGKRQDYRRKIIENRSKMKEARL